MNHAVLVGVLDGFADPGHQGENLTLRKVALFDELVQGQAVDQFHRVVVHVVM